MGLNFPNPIGVAAGFDRHGELLDELARAGFGFVEVGTINPVRDCSIDPALDRICLNLQRFHTRRAVCGAAGQPLVGVSVGGQRPSFDGEWAGGFIAAMHQLAGCADFFVLNLSRPGGPGRVAGADKSALRSLLTRIQHERGSCARHIPVMVKVAFDEDRHAKRAPLAVVLAEELGYEGVIAAFENWSSPGKAGECVARLVANLPSLPLIVVGGVNETTVGRYLAAGAAAVQVYSALVLHGPGIARRLCRAAAKFGEAVQ